MNATWEYETPWKGEPTGIWNGGRATYITNLFHSVIQREYAERCRALGLRLNESLSPLQRVIFDLDMVDKYGLDDRVPQEVRWRLREWLYKSESDKRKGAKK